MDRYGGMFGAYDDAPLDDDALASVVATAQFDDEPDHAPQAPPSPVGQDERRMQVRAYNHWAALLGEASFPDIADLHPQDLEDFGPYGVLLDFGGPGGIENPTIRFLGAELAAECGGDASFARLSDVPGRTLLSRITDHYMQILANQAPIGFEAEFTNRHGINLLYRGILLPWSSTGSTIDFIFGVINWRELADSETADALLAAIEKGFNTPVAPYEGKDMDRMLDFTRPAGNDDAEQRLSAKSTPLPTPLPAPAFGAPLDLTQEFAADPIGWDEDGDPAAAWSNGLSGFGSEESLYSVDYGDQGLEDGEAEEDVDGVVDPLADEDDAGLGLAALVTRTARVKQSVMLPGMAQALPPEAAAAPAPMPMPEAYEDDTDEIEEPLMLETVCDTPPAPPAPDETTMVTSIEPEADTEGLYDCLAAARELAQTARWSEDRGRKALYQAVARAYDFSIEAAASPEDFAELLTENGLSVQERAPMTPVVKLVFGGDCDKTRLTEYATVLGYAHRTGVARGALGEMLSRASGGLKGVVQAERQARKEAAGIPAAAERQVRTALAKKLRKLEPITLDDLPEVGGEFALVMVRRSPSGELAVLGAVPEDIALIEKAARKLLG